MASGPAIVDVAGLTKRVADAENAAADAAAKLSAATSAANTASTAAAAATQKLTAHVTAELALIEQLNSEQAVLASAITANDMKAASDALSSIEALTGQLRTGCEAATS